MTKIDPGMAVRTPLGKGVVREVRKNGRLIVLIGDRAVVVDAGSVTPGEPAKAPARRIRRAGPSVFGSALGPVQRPDADTAPHPPPPADVDLHGLVVADAIERVLAALDAAMRAGQVRLRIIHGRSGGRIRAALHRQLREVTAVRAFRLDPANDGVTIVEI